MFPRYMLAFKLFMLGIKFTSWASRLSPSFDREISRYAKLKEIGLGDHFGVQPGAGLEVGDGRE